MNHQHEGFHIGDFEPDEIVRVIGSIIGIVVFYKAIKFVIKQCIESWRTKDSAYRADCVVIPIAGVMLIAGVLGIGVLWLFCPDFR
jgi:hypothetical protein